MPDQNQRVFRAKIAARELLALTAPSMPAASVAIPVAPATSVVPPVTATSGPISPRMCRTPPGWLLISLPLSDTSAGYSDRRANARTFQSEHAFDGFSEPLSNPIQSKDPRALTEYDPHHVRLVPAETPVVGGGTIQV